MVNAVRPLGPKGRTSLMLAFTPPVGLADRTSKTASATLLPCLGFALVPHHSNCKAIVQSVQTGGDGLLGLSEEAGVTFGMTVIADLDISHLQHCYGCELDGMIASEQAHAMFTG